MAKGFVWKGDHWEEAPRKTAKFVYENEKWSIIDPRSLGEVLKEQQNKFERNLEENIKNMRDNFETNYNKHKEEIDEICNKTSFSDSDLARIANIFGGFNLFDDQNDGRQSSAAEEGEQGRTE